MSPEVLDLISDTKRLCDEFLSSDAAQPAGRAFSQIGVTSATVTETVRGFWRNWSFPPAIQQAVAALRNDQFVPERYLLVLATLNSLDRLAAAPLPDSVKKLQCQEFKFFAAPDPAWIHTFDLTSPWAVPYAGLAVLERFSAGQVHWEVSGVPRSWLLQIPARDYPRVLGALAGLGGFRPALFPHIAPPRMRVPLLLEREFVKSYSRMAECLPLQPSMLGIVTSSWLYAEETRRISPHLEWMSRMFLDNGGMISHIGYSKPDAGFLVGSRERQKAYDAGEYRPRDAIVIWPRAAVLKWARRYNPAAGEGVR